MILEILGGLLVVGAIGESLEKKSKKNEARIRELMKQGEAAAERRVQAEREKNNSTSNYGFRPGEERDNYVRDQIEKYGRLY